MSTSPAAENTNTRDWAASSKRKRQKTRELEELLVPGWGTYDLNFNTFNNPGAESLRSFIRKLDQTARWANTRSQYTANLRAEFQRGGLDLITALYRDPSKVVEDVITFDNTEDLTRHLKMQFSRPLLFQSTATRSISHPKVSWDTFWAFMRENRQKWVDVYDYSIDEEAKRTERRLVENIIKHWEKDSRTALNCLDIENRISDCCPTPISAPDDSLVVGGHFYTSAHLPSTLEGLSLLEEKQGISNESLEDSHYETLAEIFSSYDQVATPEEVKRAWATCYLFLGSPTKPRPTTSRPTTSRAKFINSLEDFNKRAAESFSQEPE